MERFRSVLEVCNLGDLGFRGSKFTWTNCREAGQFMKERLDRATANPEWCALYRQVDVSVLAARSSDHKPLLVSFSNSRSRRRQSRLFRYEAKWDHDEECAAVIPKAWRGITSGTSALQSTRLKLQCCQTALTSWNSVKYRNVEKSIEKKTKQLELLQRDEDSRHRD